MPYKEKPLEKLYYSIGEVAKELNVNVSLIRFWEKEFEILKPKKKIKREIECLLHLILKTSKSFTI
jgi:ribosome-binding protein aMBF1 (putative translation factor)